jgi:RNA polymerase sigma factor (sigma-70 family)
MTWDDVHVLVPRLQCHDPAAWAELSELAYPLILTTAAAAVGNGWGILSSSDIGQAAWMKVRNGFGSFRGADSPADTAACFRAWVRTIVRRVAVEERRRHHHPSETTAGHPEPNSLAASDPSPSSQAARTEWTSRVEAAVARLGPDERLIVRRSLYEGASCRQIAAELGVTDHTVVGGWRKDILETLRRALGGPE